MAISSQVYHSTATNLGGGWSILTVLSRYVDGAEDTGPYLEFSAGISRFQCVSFIENGCHKKVR